MSYTQILLDNKQKKDCIFIFRNHLKSHPTGFSIDLHEIENTESEILKIHKKIKLKLPPSDSDNYRINLANFSFDWSLAGMVYNTLKNSYWFKYIYENAKNDFEDTIHGLAKANCDKRLFLILKNNLDFLCEQTCFYLLKEKTKEITFTNLIPLKFTTENARVCLKVKVNSEGILVVPFLKFLGSVLPLKDCISLNNIIFINNQTLFCIENGESKKLLDSFGPQKEIIVRKADIKNYLINTLFPLQKNFDVEIPDELFSCKVKPKNKKKSIRLKELEPNFLLIEPFILYDDIPIKVFDSDNLITKGDEIFYIERDYNYEAEFIEFLKNLHPDFKNQDKGSFFYLSISQVIKQKWFFHFYKTIDDNEIDVFGQADLKKLKFNVNKPFTKITGSSGIDWFDLKVEVGFGDLKVSLKDLKNALINQQDYILLSDGSLGLIPEEWIKKLGSLVRMSDEKGNKLMVSKRHFMLVDALQEFLKEKKIEDELIEKKKRLIDLDLLNDVEIPKNINAQLRPYQTAGFQWLVQLYNLGWGGCLADDMGLGKTLQSLVFLRYVHNLKPGVRSIIICPTSLIYNWLAEAEKFVPELKVISFHGTNRIFEENCEFDLLITSYGTYRNSIEIFKNEPFEICILDESQAIKNPLANITKAVNLISTPYKYILSGTPLQNNTFDLYAQFNFINPGLLGTQEYFKAEFSTPIDKYASTEKSQLLRKIIYPFMLRRTKDLVAKDLPDKTESIIYCEMEDYQRQVYEAIKEEYRNKIFQKVEVDGIAKATFLILEGLNKLRMACDCPSLVKQDNDHTFKQESIKLNELIREINENVGNHKILIFSQFLGMLSLIKNELEKSNIKHLYLDGSTPAKDRQGLVDNFQNDAAIKAFLISIKAGGVGLNLTAADYVYIVDPWWNPAVEDQSIDRTHRIGQKNKIFAYKLICKNTIEEKIHQLQQKKKALAKEIVAEESSFIKKLTKEDIGWLLE
jgi:SNF2 family DNA or RNA helicase